MNLEYLIMTQSVTTVKKKKKKKEEGRSQRCSSQLERVLKGQIWDVVSTQLIKYSTEIQTTKKLESVSLCQG